MRFLVFISLLAFVPVVDTARDVIAPGGMKCALVYVVLLKAMCN